MSDSAHRPPARPGFSGVLIIWLAIVTLANAWTLLRAGLGMSESQQRATLYWDYPTTKPFLTLAVGSALALLGLGLLWLKRLAGLWTFLAAQLASLAVFAVLDRLSLFPTVIGLASMAILTNLVLQNRTAFRRQRNPTAPT